MLVCELYKIFIKEGYGEMYEYFTFVLFTVLCLPIDIILFPIEIIAFIIWNRRLNHDRRREKAVGDPETSEKS